MEFKHINIHTKKKLNESRIVLRETNIDGLYVTVKGLEHMPTIPHTVSKMRYHTVDSIRDILNKLSLFDVAIWNKNDEVEFNF